MPAARYVKLKATEDSELQGIENNPSLNEKVRLRAKVIRLSNCKLSVDEIAAYTGRHSTTVLRDFRRWEEGGVEGLADGQITGQQSPLREKERSFLVEKLSEERSWTASQLAEVVNEKFKLKVNRESMRICLHGLGYSWQRHRYVPVKQPEADMLVVKQTEFDVLKKEPSAARLS